MNALASQVSSASAAVSLPPADELDRALREATPHEVISAALKKVGRDKLALVSSFGTESAALLKMMAEVHPAIPVIFLDTGWLFAETLAHPEPRFAARPFAARAVGQRPGATCAITDCFHEVTE